MDLKPETNPATFARAVIDAAARHNLLPVPPDEDYYRQRSACFVSIKQEGQLRGCIGTLEPAEEDLGMEIIRNAQSAAFGDPRFPAIIEEELPSLIISVDVLSDPEPVETCEGHDCKEYGIIVRCDYRRGVLLPDLEGVDTAEDQLSIACQKAGIDHRNEQYEIHRFTVSRFDE